MILVCVQENKLVLAKSFIENESCLMDDQISVNKLKINSDKTQD